LWISPGTPVPSANKTNRHDIAEILLKVALNIKAMTLKTTKLKSQGTSHFQSSVILLLPLFPSTHEN